MDWKIELVLVPVTDVDRAKEFYVNIAQPGSMGLLRLIHDVNCRSSGFFAI